jgi:AraC-like DNA-binding protein
VYLGLQMRISSHGFLGFAAMSAGTVREALQLAERYVATRIPALGFHTYVEGDQVSLVLEERAPLEELREFVVVSLLSGLAQLGAALTGHIIRGASDVTFSEPSYFARLAHLLPGEVRFDQPSNRLIFAAAILDLPMLNADPVAAQLARTQCQRELDELGDGDRTIGRVRELLPREDGGFHALEEIARRMHVSPRTLKRRLAASGTTFTDLLDELRREGALRLLDNRQLTIESIADQLGYSDVANFTRAFRRWTGTTPATFRKR